MSLKNSLPATRRAVRCQSRRWIAAALVAAAFLVAGPGIVVAAQTRIGINGGRPSQWPILDQLMAGSGYTQEGWLEFASHVGENWLPGTDPVPLDYPAQLGIVSGPGALTTDQSTEIGRQLLHAAILRELEAGQPIVVAGLSQGTLVIEKELLHLQDAPDAPQPDTVTFYLYGGMQRGLGDMYLRGLTIPFIGQTFAPVPDSQYDVVVVNEQWDGWANPPDRPWNLLAVVNSVMGAVYSVNGTNDHSHTSLAYQSEAVLVSRITNPLGGTTTTYLIPRQELPVTRPLRQLGVPDTMVDELDKFLTPIINTGYSSVTPYLGPRIHQGRLVFTPPPPPVIEPEETSERDDQTAVNVVAAAEVTDGSAVALPSLSPVADAEGSTESGQAADDSIERTAKVDKQLRLHRDRPAVQDGFMTRDRTDRVDATSSKRDRTDRFTGADRKKDKAAGKGADRKRDTSESRADSSAA